MSHPEHDSVPAWSLQLQALLQKGWEQEVLARLPDNAEQQASALGAFVRSRKLGCVGDLLRGLLAYVLNVSSLRHLGAWATLIGFACLSHVAWQRRLQKARDWLLWLVSERLAVSAPATPLAQQRVILLDATRLKEPGGCGDDWRVHLGYDLVAGRLCDLRVSDQHTAEGFTLFAWRPGDLVVADRGYSQRRQWAHVLQAGGEVLVRLAVSKAPLLDAQQQPLDVVAWLKAQGSGEHSCAVFFEHNGQRFAGRLIASSLPEEAAERARCKERRKASKKQFRLSEETLYLCGWFLLFTSLPSTQWSDEQVRTLSRARWQIELVIKRLKQVLKLAQVRGKTRATNEATILAVLLAWSLIQSEVAWARETLTQGLEHWVQAHHGKPCDDASKPPTQASVSSWTVLALWVHTLRVQVQGVWTAERLQQCWPELMRFVVHRRRRPHQEQCIRASLLARWSSALPVSALFSCSSP